MPIAVLYNAWCFLIMGTDEIRTRLMCRTGTETFRLAETKNKSSRFVVLTLSNAKENWNSSTKIFLKVANVVCVEETVGG
jgi:hypothetical protein